MSRFQSFLALCLCVTLAACGSNGDSTGPSNGGNKTPASEITIVGTTTTTVKGIATSHKVGEQHLIALGDAAHTVGLYIHDDTFTTGEYTIVPDGSSTAIGRFAHANYAHFANNTLKQYPWGTNGKIKITDVNAKSISGEFHFTVSDSNGSINLSGKFTATHK